MAMTVRMRVMLHIVRKEPENRALSGVGRLFLRKNIYRSSCGFFVNSVAMSKPNTITPHIMEAKL